MRFGLVLEYIEAFNNDQFNAAYLMYTDGYGFARFKFWGRGFLFALVIITMIVPPQTLMLPLYLHFQSFDILGIISASHRQGRHQAAGQLLAFHTYVADGDGA